MKQWTKRHTRSMENEIDSAIEDKAEELGVTSDELNFETIEEIVEEVKGLWHWDYEVNNNEY